MNVLMNEDNEILYRNTNRLHTHTLTQSVSKLLHCLRSFNKHVSNACSQKQTYVYHMCLLGFLLPVLDSLSNY